MYCAGELTFISVWATLPGTTTAVQCKLCVNRATGCGQIVERRHIKQHELARRHQLQYEELKHQQAVDTHRRQPRADTNPRTDNCQRLLDPSGRHPSPSQQPKKVSSGYVATAHTESNTDADDTHGDELVPVSDLWDIQDEEIVVSVRQNEDSLRRSYLRESSERPDSGESESVDQSTLTGDNPTAIDADAGTCPGERYSGLTVIIIRTAPFEEAIHRRKRPELPKEENLYHPWTSKSVRTWRQLAK